MDRRPLGPGPDRARLVGAACRFRVGVPDLATGVVRAGAVRGRGGGRAVSVRGERRAAAADRARPAARRADAARARQRGAAGQVPARARPRRGVMVPVLLRAGRGFRPGRRADPGGARQGWGGRGGRLDRGRPEGVDLGRPVGRPRDAARADRPGRAQAPRAQLLHHRCRPARHRGQAAASDERRARVQRGVLRRRARRRRPAGGRGGRRLVGRGDRADVRAVHGRAAIGAARREGGPPGGSRRARPRGAPRRRAPRAAPGSAS